MTGAGLDYAYNGYDLRESTLRIEAYIRRVPQFAAATADSDKANVMLLRNSTFWEFCSP